MSRSLNGFLSPIHIFQPLVPTAFTGYPSISIWVPTLHMNSSFPLILSIFLSQIRQKYEEGVEDVGKLGISSAIQLMLSSSDKDTQQLIANAQKEFESMYFLFNSIL